MPALFFALVVLLTGFGALMVYSASVFKYGGSQYYFFKREVIWTVLGFLAMWGAYRVPLEKVRDNAPLIFGATLLALLLVFSPLGVKVLGARRWLNFGFFRFQPSEALKYVMLIMLAWWYDKEKRDAGQFVKGVLVPLFFVLSGVVLVVLEKDLGTPVLICAVSMLVCLAGGMKLIYAVIAGVGMLFAGAALIIMEPYRFRRLISFIDPTSDSLGTNYQSLQALMAICSGKLDGVGLGNSVFKTAYLPEAHTDFIFAIIGEELGFVGSLGLISAFALLIIIMWRLTSIMEDTFCRLLGYGITLTIGLQTLINIGVTTALLPNKGMGLPFISYGGSSLLFLLAACGLFLNMSKGRIKAVRRVHASVSGGL